MRPVVVGYDGSDASRAGIRHAASLANVLGSPLLAVRVAEAGEDVQEVAETLFDLPFDIRLVEAASAAAGLREVARGEHAELLVVGADAGRSVARDLLRDAPCPVVVVPPRWTPPDAVRTVACAFDGRHPSRKALDAATSVARRLGAALQLVGVAVPSPDGLSRHFVRDALRDGLNMSGGHGVTMLVEGDPAVEIARACEEVDLVVIGSHGYGPVREALFGSVSRDLISRSPCPVMVVPASADPSELTDPVGTELTDPVGTGHRM